MVCMRSWCLLVSAHRVHRGGYRREGMRSIPSRIRLGSIHYASAFPHVACALAVIHRIGYGMSVPRTAVCRQRGGSVRSYAISHSPRFHSQKERSGHCEKSFIPSLSSVYHTGCELSIGKRKNMDKNAKRNSKYKAAIVATVRNGRYG